MYDWLCFFKFDVIFLLCHIGLVALPLPSGHMFPQLKCIFASWNSQMLTTQLVSFQFCCVFCLFWCFCMYVFHCCVGVTPSPMAVSMFFYIFNTLYIYFICGHFGGMHVVSVFVFAFGCCMWSCFGFLGCPLLLFYGSLLLVILFPFQRNLGTVKCVGSCAGPLCLTHVLQVYVIWFWQTHLPSHTKCISQCVTHTWPQGP